MRFLIIVFFSLLFLSACGPTKDSSQQAQIDPEENARLLMQSGDYAGAATEYLDLAARDKQNPAIYRLKAATAYIEAGLFNDAQRILDETQIPENDSLQNSRQHILRARLELEFGQPGKAINLLNELSAPELGQGLRLSYHDILARAYLAHGDYLQAINERIQLQNYLGTPTEIDQNNRSLWQIFEAIPETDLDDLRLVAPTELVSWFELASLYQSYRFQPGKLKNAIDGWVQRYPGHPAYTSIVPQLVDTSSQLVNRPAKIGLLLPFSGQYKKASTAIRDGFLAARYLDAADKPDVEIYDTNALDIVETYNQAVSEGVDYVVGPLEKEAIKRLNDLNNLPVQVLALNRQDTESGNEQMVNKKLIQFALSPEDEARQIAEAALADGHTLALVITPNIPWGQRIAEAFKNRWIELGGGVLEHTFFESNGQDFATPVKELLNIDSSEQRGRDLRSKLNRKIHNVERRREDADFIFTAAVPGDARQLFPQFRFYRASDLPVYSTSHIFNGVINETRDSDMEGVIFIDMPWILDTSRQLSLIQDALNRNWSQDKSNYRRLYALGIDAYRIIPELGRLSTDKNSYLNGETGDLTISSDNIIKRKLRRAQFFKGKPILLN
ncbi:MAG: penicillin-binding protein activator [Proteobacteria bacterium]|nr:penicillin-binding protein activator [Pseudomonadota bacterium]